MNRKPKFQPGDRARPFGSERIVTLIRCVSRSAYGYNRWECKFDNGCSCNLGEGILIPLSAVERLGELAE